jgi:hypothetical protein
MHLEVLKIFEKIQVVPSGYYKEVFAADQK